MNNLIELISFSTFISSIIIIIVVIRFISPEHSLGKRKLNMIVEQIWTANTFRNFNYLIAFPEMGKVIRSL